MAIPDPTFYFDADPDPDSVHMLEIRKKLGVFIYSNARFTWFYLSPDRHRCHNFQHFG
jgi:hypothetical protein